MNLPRAGRLVHRALEHDAGAALEPARPIRCSIAGLERRATCVVRTEAIDTLGRAFLAVFVF